MKTTYETFISYRRQGGSELAAELYDRLADHAVSAFMDIEELRAGNFERQLIQNNKNSRVLVLLLSPGMLDRWNEPNDYVRKEIELFLTTDRPIIVVQFDGFSYDTAPQSPMIQKLQHNYPHIRYMFGNEERLVDDILKILRAGWTKEECDGAIECHRRIDCSRRKELGKDRVFIASQRSESNRGLFWSLLVLIPAILMLFLRPEGIASVILPWLYAPFLMVCYSNFLFDEFEDESFFTALLHLIGAALAVAAGFGVVLALHFGVLPVATDGATYEYTERIIMGVSFAIKWCAPVVLSVRLLLSLAQWAVTHTTKYFSTMFLRTTRLFRFEHLMYIIGNIAAVAATIASVAYHLITT